MRTAEVSYEQMRSFGSYCNEKYRVIVAVEDGDDPEAVMRAARARVNAHLDASQAEREETAERERQEYNRQRVAQMRAMGFSDDEIESRGYDPDDEDEDEEMPSREDIEAEEYRDMLKNVGPEDDEE